jgi:hypothetical protein
LNGLNDLNDLNGSEATTPIFAAEGLFLAHDFPFNWNPGLFIERQNDWNYWNLWNGWNTSSAHSHLARQALSYLELLNTSTDSGQALEL